VNGARHDHHDRVQEIHRRFGVEAGDPGGRAGDIREQNGRLLALTRHVGDASLEFSRLTAPGAEPGAFGEILSTMGTHRSKGAAASHAEPARGLVLVSTCVATHRQSAVDWITSAVPL
jgi:hypothetical protein